MQSRDSSNNDGSNNTGGGGSGAAGAGGAGGAGGGAGGAGGSSHRAEEESKTKIYLLDGDGKKKTTLLYVHATKSSC